MFNPFFYKGKINGHLTRIASIIALSTAFYILNGIKPNRKIRGYVYSGIIGFIVSVILAVVCYIYIPSDHGIIYQSIAIILCYSSFYGVRKIKSSRRNH
jgi:hypothetical protein